MKHCESILSFVLHKNITLENNFRSQVNGLCDSTGFSQTNQVKSLFLLVSEKIIETLKQEDFNTQKNILESIVYPEIQQAIMLQLIANQFPNGHLFLASFFLERKDYHTGLKLAVVNKSSPIPSSCLKLGAVLGPAFIRPLVRKTFEETFTEAKCIP